jgi:HSP20 family protein
VRFSLPRGAAHQEVRHPEHRELLDDLEAEAPIERHVARAVRLEVPGFHKENLDINLTGELLTITGTREIAPEIEGEGYLVKERVYGKFVRTIRLPAPVAEKKVTAEYRDGVLVLHLVKEIAVPATKILIK